MKSIILSIIIIGFIPASAMACPTLVSFNLKDYVFDGVYENTGFDYRASDADLLKGDLSNYSKTLQPDENHYNPELAELGGCFYSDVEDNNGVKIEVFATYWPEGTLYLTIVRIEAGKGNYIQAEVTKNSGFFYDETYGPYDSSYTYDHKFADILSPTLKLIYAE